MQAPSGDMTTPPEPGLGAIALQNFRLFLTVGVSAMGISWVVKAAEDAAAANNIAGLQNQMSLAALCDSDSFVSCSLAVN